MNHTLDVMQVISARRTIREYETAPVPMEHIRLIIEAAIHAPSGYNMQPWRFIAVRDPEFKTQMADAVRLKVSEIEKWPAAKGKEAGVRALVNGYTVFERAPLAIAVLLADFEVLIDKIYRDKGLSFEEHFKLRGGIGFQTIAAAIQNMLLAATSLGYGTCWGTGCLVAKEALEKLLKVQFPWSLVAVVSIGVPQEKPPVLKRKSVDDVLEIY